MSKEKKIDKSRSSGTSNFKGLKQFRERERERESFHFLLLTPARTQKEVILAG